MNTNERGSINPLLIPLILSVLFFFTAFGFGVWAFMSREDYKNNSDKKSEVASKIAVDKAKTDKDNEFIEKEKQPYRDYESSVALGSITFKYPKTWSGYYKETNTEMTLLMQPKLVIGNDKSLYPLRIEVVNIPYDKMIDSLESRVKNGKLSASPYRLEQLQEIVGTRFEGEIDNNKQGSLVILPLRDKSIRISVESSDFVDDFDNIILKNFTFSP